MRSLIKCFYQCYSLNTVIIPNVTLIENSFADCTELEYIEADSLCEIEGDFLFGSSLMKLKLYAPLLFGQRDDLVEQKIIKFKPLQVDIV